MILNLFSFSPLEQFDILPLIDLYFGFVDFSITNETVILGLIFFFVSVLLLSSLKPTDSTLYIVPHRWQSIIEQIYKGILSLSISNVDRENGQLHFPLFFALFFFVICANVIGLIPYSFTLTSHIIVTFSLGLFFFIGVNIICIQKHGVKLFSLFLPAGTCLISGLLIVPIELISFVFKPISLSIRLFANMMAGHTLLKIIAGFAWNLMGATGIAFFVHYVPLLAIIVLFGLELGVSLIQACVFTLLCTMYLSDAIKLH